MRLLACTLELFRQAQTPKKDSEFFKALWQLAQVSGDINWGAVPFSITQASLLHGITVAKQYGATDKTASAIVSAALVLFVDLIENGLADEDVPAQDIFNALIAEVAESPKTPLNANQPPEIYNERMIARVYQPAQFTEQTAATLEASLVTFRDKLPNGERGPSLRGVAIDNGTNTHHILLETGEFVRRANGDASVVGTNTADDYLAVCPALLAYFRAAVNELAIAAVIDINEKLACVSDKNCLGTFTKPLFNVVAATETVLSLENVISAAQEATSRSITGATGPTGATVRFPVSNTDYTVVLDAVTATSGPYVVAKLMRGDTVVMRLDQPRQFSVLGVYLFPLRDCAVSLSVIYNR